MRFSDVNNFAASICGMKSAQTNCNAARISQLIKDIAVHKNIGIENTIAVLHSIKDSIQATEHPNKQTTLAPGPWYQYQYTDAEGLVIDCHLEYEAAEKQTHDSPGHCETVDLIYALVNGVDIFEVLSDDVKGLIEEEAIHSMEMDRWDDDYDKGEQRALDRAEERTTCV